MPRARSCGSGCGAMIVQRKVLSLLVNLAQQVSQPGKIHSVVYWRFVIPGPSAHTVGLVPGVTS